MTSSVYNAGYPVFVDGAYYPAALLRQYDGGVSVYDAGTAAAVSPAGGVFGLTDMQVAAGAGLTVTVSAGYCSVPNTAGTGAYRFGLMTQATLAVATNSSGSTRKDYVLANVQDLGSTGSFAQVEYVTGTASFPAVPANSIILAAVQVPNGAASIVSGDITDERAQVVPPGCLIPISSLGAAPTVPTGTLMYDTATGQLVYSPYTVVTEILTGAGTWYPPEGILGGTIYAAGTAAGAGGTCQGDTGSGAGAGSGEWACEPELAVVFGTGCAYSCGTAGKGGTPEGQNASDGGDTTFQGSSVLVHAHGGQIVSGSQAGGLPGSGSTNTLHYPGGTGGNGDSGNDGYGGGGAAAGSPLGPGANGADATTTADGAGGVGEGGAGSGGQGGYGYGSYDNFNPSAQAGQAPGGAGGGAGAPITSAANGGNGQVFLSYILAPGASPYPIAGSADYWYGYEPSTSAIGGISIVIEADGVSDYRIVVQAAGIASAGYFFELRGQLVIAANGTQLDAIAALPLTEISTRRFNAGWTYYTSGAQGTTLAKGTHTITFEGSYVDISGPAWIRVDQVLT